MTTKLPTGVDESSLRDYYYSCNELSARCPVQATTLGYMPNAGVNYFLTIGFGLAGITTLTIGVWKKTWSFMAFVTAGCMLEMAGRPLALLFHPHNNMELAPDHHNRLRLPHPPQLQPLEQTRLRNPNLRHRPRPHPPLHLHLPHPQALLPRPQPPPLARPSPPLPLHLRPARRVLPARAGHRRRAGCLGGVR